MSTCVFDPGLERAWATLERGLVPGREAQVVLLYGAKGGGMESLAEALVRRWLGGEDSGNLNLERAVDFQRFQPSGASRLHKMIIVSERNSMDDPEFDGIPILKYFRTTPLKFASKVVWIEDADRMNSAVSNALLKTLEEVPSFARVVMTTSDLGRVLPTVRSRSLCVACGGVISEDLSSMEAAFADTPGRLAFIRQHAEIFESVYSVLEATRGASLGEAMVFSERLREASAQLAKDADIGARSANAEVLEAMASWARKTWPNRPHLAQSAAESYRLVTSNANAGLAFDVLMGLLLE